MCTCHTEEEEGDIMRKMMTVDPIAGLGKP
jgi:hypothetical protein